MEGDSPITALSSHVVLGPSGISSVVCGCSGAFKKLDFPRIETLIRMGVSSSR